MSRPQVRGGRVFWTTNDGVSIRLRSVSLRGDRPRDLFSGMTDGRVVSRVDFGVSSVFYTTKPPPKSTANGTYGAVPAPRSGPNAFLGEFLPSPHAHLAAGEIIERLPTRPPTPPSPSVELHEMPLNGGEPRTVTIRTPGARADVENAKIVGRTAYWVEMRPTESIRIHTPHGLRDEHEPRCRLMAASLDGGEARVAAEGLFDTFLMRTNVGVCWWMPRHYPDARKDLHCLDAADATPHVLPDMPAGVQVMEYRGRYYWIEPEPFLASRQGSSIARTRILSCDRDGTDRRLVLQAPRDDGLRVGYTALIAERDRLYLLYRTWNPPRARREEGYYGDPGPGNVRSFLAVLKPGPTVSLGATTRLPDGAEPYTACIDGDYCYVEGSETHENWLDWSASGTRTEHALYRVRLPE